MKSVVKVLARARLEEQVIKAFIQQERRPEPALVKEIVEAVARLQTPSCPDDVLPKDNSHVTTSAP